MRQTLKLSCEEFAAAWQGIRDVAGHVVYGRALIQIWLRYVTTFSLHNSKNMLRFCPFSISGSLLFPKTERLFLQCAVCVLLTVPLPRCLPCQQRTAGQPASRPAVSPPIDCRIPARARALLFLPRGGPLSKIAYEEYIPRIFLWNTREYQRISGNTR